MVRPDSTAGCTRGVQAGQAALLPRRRIVLYCAHFGDRLRGPRARALNISWLIPALQPLHGLRHPRGQARRVQGRHHRRRCAEPPLRAAPRARRRAARLRPVGTPGRANRDASSETRGRLAGPLKRRTGRREARPQLGLGDRGGWGLWNSAIPPPAGSSPSSRSAMAIGPLLFFLPPPSRVAPTAAAESSGVCCVHARALRRSLHGGGGARGAQPRRPLPAHAGDGQGAGERGVGGGRTGTWRDGCT